MEKIDAEDLLELIEDILESEEEDVQVELLKLFQQHPNEFQDVLDMFTKDRDEQKRELDETEEMYEEAAYKVEVLAEIVDDNSRRLKKHKSRKEE